MPAFKGLASFSLDTAPLCAETAELAERELRETPEQVQKSLAELRNLLKGTVTLSKLRYPFREDEIIIIIIKIEKN